MAMFDSLAPTYDADFTRSQIARHLRARVHARLDRLCEAGDEVLELGCGTGEDALHLARRGVRVLATDTSAAMLAVAREKLAGYDHARVELLDLRDVAMDKADAPLRVPTGFRVAFANFGVLNCLDDWRPLAAWLAARITVGGHAAFAVMPPACLWEMAWHGLHGEWSVATRRWRRDGAAFGAHSFIYYPSVARLTRDFAPWFRRVHVEPLGLLLPPSDIYGVIEKRPRLLRTLTALDDGVGRLPVLANFGDHYWIEFRRRGD
jgi:SAM-dependent methyltransferase